MKVKGKVEFYGSDTIKFQIIDNYNNVIHYKKVPKLDLKFNIAHILHLSNLRVHFSIKPNGNKIEHLTTQDFIITYSTDSEYIKI